MKSLTLNNIVTQSSNTFLLVRCRSLAGSNQFQYEAMINNQWQPVTHKFVEFVWSIYYSKQRALVKINPLSYIVKALAKSSAEISLSEFEHERHRSYCGFFVRNTLVLLSNYDLGNGAEKLAGCVYNRSANVTLIIYSMVGWVGAPQGAPGSCSPVRLTSFSSPPIRLASAVVSFINLNTRAVFMTTIPNEIVSNKTISIDQIDIINKKLLQAEAILHLLSVNSRAEIQINDNLVCDVLWATSDLVADARRFLHTDKSKEANL